MPYISLYRKYRSQSFDDVVGQDHVVRTICNAIKAGKIGQGYLFCGSRGTGKTTIARLIAKALNCESGPTPNPCNKCEACLSIMEGNAVDVVEMDAASNRGVDDVDTLREGVKYPPMRLRYKVYIIDEAHQLSSTAKDAFLKTLEEPPAHAVFILATTEAHKIPITIRSRCQQFDFRRGTVDEISSRLKHVVNGEGATIDGDAVDLIARSANGSYRDSLSLLEQVMAYTDGDITSKDVSTVLGLVEEDVLIELGNVLAGRDTAAAFGVADRLMREGRDVRELLKSLANHFRDLLALKVGADGRHRDDDRWRAQAEEFSQDRLVRIIDEFAAAEKDLKWNDQHRLGLEMALLRAMARPAAQAAPHVQVESPVAPAPAPRPTAAPARPEPKYEPEPEPEPAIAKPAPVEKRIDGPVEPVNLVAETEDELVEAGGDSEAPVAASSAGTANSVSLSEVQRNWKKVLAHIQKVLKQPNAAALIQQGRPLDITDSILTVGFTRKWNFHRNKVDSVYLPIIQKALADVMGADMRIRTDVIDESDEPADNGRAQSKQKEEPVQHPLLDDVLTTFGGRIVADDTDPWEDQG